MIRGLFGILTGFVCWASLWGGLNALLPLVFPKMFKHDGMTENYLLNLLIVLLSADFAFLAGLWCAKIAKIHERRFAFVLGLLQLGGALYLYQAHGPRLPVGFYVAFLTFIMPAVIAGAVYQTIDKGKSEAS